MQNNLYSYTPVSVVLHIFFFLHKQIWESFSLKRLFSKYPSQDISGLNFENAPVDLPSEFLLLSPPWDSHSCGQVV